MKSILQQWVINLGLRHQGVLLSVVRGCDNVGKEDASKAIARALRGTFLFAFDLEPSSFIELHVEDTELEARFSAFLRNFDHLPIHFVMHLMFAAEIIGYKHPIREIRLVWQLFYRRLVHKLHLRPESEDRLDERLNACEAEFHANQDQ
jgi:hypothetical protein